MHHGAVQGQGAALEGGPDGAAHAGAMGQEDEEVTSTKPEAGTGPSAGTSPQSATEKWGRPRVRGGGVVLIGPIPIVFGSDSSTARGLMLLAMGLMAMAIVLMILLALL